MTPITFKYINKDLLVTLINTVHANQQCLYVCILMQLIGASLSEPHTSVTSLRTRVCIRESVDSLCRDGADAQYMQYLSKSRITSPQIR